MVLRASVLSSIIIALCLPNSGYSTCNAVTDSGCNLGGDFLLPVSMIEIACTGLSATDCAGDDDPVTIISDCTSTPTPSPTPTETCEEWLESCCTAPTEAPTDSPTSSPTAEPTGSPSTSPTPEPTGSPSVSPSADPTESPSSAPSPVPTRSPNAASDSFFDEDTNVYAVAGGGGGLLLLALLGMIFMRRSGDDDDQEQLTAEVAPGASTGQNVKIDIFDWEKHIDKKSGEVYFFNPKTGESRWDPPEI